MVIWQIFILQSVSKRFDNIGKKRATNPRAFLHYLGTWPYNPGNPKCISIRSQTQVFGWWQIRRNPRDMSVMSHVSPTSFTAYQHHAQVGNLYKRHHFYWTIWRSLDLWPLHRRCSQSGLNRRFLGCVFFRTQKGEPTDCQLNHAMPSHAKHFWIQAIQHRRVMQTSKVQKGRQEACANFTVKCTTILGVRGREMCP